MQRSNSSSMSYISRPQTQHTHKKCTSEYTTAALPAPVRFKEFRGCCFFLPEQAPFLLMPPHLHRHSKCGRSLGNQKGPTYKPGRLLSLNNHGCSLCTSHHLRGCEKWSQRNNPDLLASVLQHDHLPGIPSIYESLLARGAGHSHLGIRRHRSTFLVLPP